ncbi:hypothetical protein Sm713_47820 [Streptomyces sp. TS71-3]|nr:hypothetical protein Sm713_47820 [Streptomyces sp. TS71-3]
MQSRRPSAREPWHSLCGRAAAGDGAHRERAAQREYAVYWERSTALSAAVGAYAHGGQREP